MTYPNHSHKPSWQRVAATVEQGHRVASGLNGNPRFPGGTLAMQFPFFRAGGLDLSDFYSGTLNLNISPWQFQIIKPRHHFASLRWHPTEPPEDFSFFDCRLIFKSTSPVTGLVYYPHPETKPAHFQPIHILEVLLPKLEDLHYGATVTLELNPDQLALVPG